MGPLAAALHQRVVVRMPRAPEHGGRRARAARARGGGVRLGRLHEECLRAVAGQLRAEQERADAAKGAVRPKGLRLRAGQGGLRPPGQRPLRVLAARLEMLALGARRALL